MTKLFNKTAYREARRALRSNMPKPEGLVWARIRSKQVLECRFRRQYGVGPYILDFYCPSVRLAVEIDGDTHFDEAAESGDRERQSFVESFGIKFLRFTNREVLDNLDGVETIRTTVLGLLPIEENETANSLPPQVPLSKGDNGVTSASD